MKVENGVCRGCGKPILWATTDEGKRIAFDAKAAQFLEFAEASGAFLNTGHINHFVTCQKREQFRKKRPSGAIGSGE